MIPIRRPLGRLDDGTPVELVELSAGALTARVTTWGASLVALEVPDRDGRPGDVVLGFDSLKGYLGDHPYLGSTVGRVANRIANARFELDGVEHRLAANNGPHSLHGGVAGFDKRLWSLETREVDGVPEARFSRTSPDGEEGFPGTLEVEVVYRLALDALTIDYRATTDRPTLVNLTNHAYFNLSAGLAPTILDHRVMFESDAYTPADATLIPTGAIVPSAGTPFDFRTPRAVGDRIDEVGGNPPGYDHNQVLRPIETTGEPRLAATVVDPISGRRLELSTTEPGVQFYTGNFLDGSIVGKGGRRLERHAGFCLEPQVFPDAIHHPGFPSAILRPGEIYRHISIYRFGIDRAE
ncbi:MAG: aldose epimerase family protein [Isosphaeraceae bacterium]|nr:aldose epimerase family protein [Isosphaeraceae bacterium]